MTLALCGVVLTSRHLEGVLSSCSDLMKLNIEFSELPSKLQLTGTVIDVVILDCDGGKEIDLHAAYLRTLEYKIRNDYSYIFGDHARDLPNQVKSLTLEFIPDQDDFPIANPTEIKTFRKLTILRLVPVTSHGILQIFELSKLLGDFPLLQSLTFAVFKVASLMERTRSRRPPPSLKEMDRESPPRASRIVLDGHQWSRNIGHFTKSEVSCPTDLGRHETGHRILREPHVAHKHYGSTTPINHSTVPPQTLWNLPHVLAQFPSM
ncbi:hypothetical protein CQW23_30553 [Capsicum baccatum]|uniref:Uncharacterized protein n=1 Tax=Capsicum baccatum TaxID=33114 RepID=A0A2G2VA93_CAPBA|nr:hypothetical protein CQW23_30553 [Capsicum baccatum]